ncbi:hypothetical protein SGFS_055500 [Streptomyces graminofaciens]|uniref:Secreted protein n=1 Tax=Streptomyces graminofaciens TaxID=68212 RepID=A0ABN5VLI4_9ACTN|nr:hypothetical protein SGFS_055500 [Streptomyces graminofaciens]
MRTTVASLVPVRAARPVTVSAAQPAGSAATASATRCMERVMEGASVRTFAASAAGAGGACPVRPSAGAKLSFTSSLTL